MNVGKRWLLSQTSTLSNQGRSRQCAAIFWDLLISLSRRARNIAQFKPAEWPTGHNDRMIACKLFFQAIHRIILHCSHTWVFPDRQTRDNYLGEPCYSHLQKLHLSRCTFLKLLLQSHTHKFLVRLTVVHVQRPYQSVAFRKYWHGIRNWNQKLLRHEFRL